MSKNPTKRNILKWVKDGAAGLVDKADLESLLGEDNYDSIIDNEELLEYAYLQQQLISKRIFKG